MHLLPSLSSVILINVRANMIYGVTRKDTTASFAASSTAKQEDDDDEQINVTTDVCFMYFESIITYRSPRRAGCVYEKVCNTRVQEI